MRIRSLRMQESEGMTSESSSPPHLFAPRPSDLGGNTLTSPSLVERLNRSQTLSGTTTPARTLREAGSHQTSAISASSSPGGTPTPPPSQALVSALSNTVPTAAFAPDEDRTPLAARQHLLDDLANLLRRLSISESSHFLQHHPAPPPTSPTTSVNPANLHASGNESLGGSMPPELPEANGASSSVGSRLGSHSESDAPAQRQERGRGSRRRATRRARNPYPERRSEGGGSTSSAEAQSIISRRRSEASSTGVSRATSSISSRPLLSIPEVAIIASNSPPPSHSLQPLPFDITAFFAEHPPPDTIGADDPVGDALGIVLHAVATADPLLPPYEPSSEPLSEAPRATHYREPLPTTPAPPGVNYYRRNHYRDHPGPEWYPYRPDQHFSRLTIPDEEGRQVEAKYLSVRVVQGEPTIMGTMGYGQPVHSESLHALPFAAPAPAHFHIPSFSILQNPFDPRTERALDGLGDLGVQAEVYRLRRVAHQRMEVLHRRVALQEETRQQCQRWEDLYALEESVDREEEAVKERLKAAQAFLRMDAHTTLDREPGEVPSPTSYFQMTGRRAKHNSRSYPDSGCPGGSTGATLISTARSCRPVRPCGYCGDELHYMYDCPFPHCHCDQLVCRVKSWHAQFLPLTACPYHRLRNARARLTPQEEDEALQDLVGEEYLD